MTFHRSLVSRRGLGNPYAWIVDAAAQAGTKTASIAAGEPLKAERAAKMSAAGKKIELEAEQIRTGSEMELALAQAEALRIQAATAGRSTEKKTTLILAGAAGIGVLALLALVMSR